MPAGLGPEVEKKEVDEPLLWAIELVLDRVGVAFTWLPPLWTWPALQCLQQLAPSGMTRNADDGLLHRLNLLGLHNWVLNRSPAQWPRATSRAFAALVAASPVHTRSIGYRLLDLACLHMAVVPLRKEPFDWNGFAFAVADDDLWAFEQGDEHEEGDGGHTAWLRSGAGRTQLEQLLAEANGSDGSHAQRRQCREAVLTLVDTTYPLADLRRQFGEYLTAFQAQLPPPFLDQVVHDLTSAACYPTSRRESNPERVGHPTPPMELGEQSQEAKRSDERQQAWETGKTLPEEGELVLATQDEHWYGILRPGTPSPDLLDTDDTGLDDCAPHSPRGVATCEALPETEDTGSAGHLVGGEDNDAGAATDGSGESDARTPVAWRTEPYASEMGLESTGTPATATEHEARGTDLEPEPKRRRSEDSPIQSEEAGAAKRRRLLADKRACDDACQVDSSPDYDRDSSWLSARSRRRRPSTTSYADAAADRCAASAAPRASSGRRPRRRWTQDEVANLLAGVKRFGVGNWKLILERYHFDARTAVDLKDKHRNIEKQRP